MLETLISFVLLIAENKINPLLVGIWLVEFTERILRKGLCKFYGKKNVLRVPDTAIYENTKFC